MNKIFKSVAVMCLCAGMILFAVSCGKKNEATDKGNTTIQNQTGNQNQTEQNGTENQTPENEVPKAPTPTNLVFGEDKSEIEIAKATYAVPCEKDVIDAFNKASEAVLWFNMYSVPALDKEAVYVQDGVHYAKVKSKSVTNLETMRQYLETLFVYDLADLIMDDNSDTQRFIEREDGLYCVAYARFRGVTDEVFSVSKVSDEEYVISVSYKVIDFNGEYTGEGQSEYSFIKQDGNWVFDEGFALHRI